MPKYSNFQLGRRSPYYLKFILTISRPPRTNSAHVHQSSAKSDHSRLSYSWLNRYLLFRGDFVPPVGVLDSIEVDFQNFSVYKGSYAPSCQI